MFCCLTVSCIYVVTFRCWYLQISLLIPFPVWMPPFHQVLPTFKSFGHGLQSREGLITGARVTPQWLPPPPLTGVPFGEEFLGWPPASVRKRSESQLCKKNPDGFSTLTGPLLETSFGLEHSRQPFTQVTDC